MKSKQIKSYYEKKNCFVDLFEFEDEFLARVSMYTIMCRWWQTQLYFVYVTGPPGALLFDAKPEITLK